MAPGPELKFNSDGAQSYPDKENCQVFDGSSTFACKQNTRRFCIY